MRLIDATALTEQIRKLCHYEYMANWLGVLIDTQPTVKVKPIEVPKPVRHGKWIFGTTLGHSWMKCSECCVSQNGQTATFTYCPNCGAKMDAEREEE